MPHPTPSGDGVPFEEALATARNTLFRTDCRNLNSTPQSQVTLELEVLRSLLRGVDRLRAQS